MSQNLPGMSAIPEGTISVAGALIPVEAVNLIVGESGISLSGGEMLIWKRTVVVAGGNRHVSNRPPGENKLNFERWIAACPRAVGVRPDGTVTLPRIGVEGNEDPLMLLGDALSAVKRELGSQIMRGLVWATVFLVGGIALMASIIAYDVQHPNNMMGFKIGLLGLVFVVCAVLLAGRAIWLWGRRQRIVRVVRDLTHRGELNSDLLAEAIVPPGPTTARPPAVSIVPATLSILAIGLSFCPFVGLVLALIAIGLTFRKPSWARVLAIIGLVISALMTIFVIFQIAMGH